MLQAVANADLERLARLASVMDNCATSLAVLCKVVSAACPEEVKTVQYITQVHAEDGQEARSAMRDVAAAAMFDIIRRHVLHGSALAFPLRECVALPSARANEILQGTPAAYGREKHVPCSITAMEFMRGSVLGIVVQVLASTRAWAAEQGLLRRAEHGSPIGDGLVLAGGSIHNTLQPASQRMVVAQADTDVFVVGAVSAAAGACMAAQFFEGLAHRVEVVQDSLLLTERTVSAQYVIPPAAPGGITYCVLTSSVPNGELRAGNRERYLLPFLNVLFKLVVHTVLPEVAAGVPDVCRRPSRLYRTPLVPFCKGTTLRLTQLILAFQSRAYPILYAPRATSKPRYVQCLFGRSVAGRVRRRCLCNYSTAGRSAFRDVPTAASPDLPSRLNVHSSSAPALNLTQCTSSALRPLLPRLRHSPASPEVLCNCSPLPAGTRPDCALRIVACTTATWRRRIVLFRVCFFAVCLVLLWIANIARDVQVPRSRSRPFWWSDSSHGRSGLPQPLALVSHYELLPLYKLFRQLLHRTFRLSWHFSYDPDPRAAYVSQCPPQLAGSLPTPMLTLRRRTDRAPALFRFSPPP
ncbi:hypothetical protein VOLCADRAFT_107857 [Volvox carteri f. nagariensis]|uniref:Uncharacterized protein n=1 Tax=Volvox carteri f. nagariensis TaxID=3068 RepID=D8UGW2_VOLCA|nr:uncharacterized protein VOLCADRAFT_107857 [Volvox carteri f. nagariensis]EFJ41021.1 hypothetical protein VOLCADRAFT_107857 [Volvox carteri f. nagariensis]|eukprot:XP_002957885.1 hypothetical protein VOLCADRAFT_107857 [Volvox carteri f. nagariensis]